MDCMLDVPCEMLSERLFSALHQQAKSLKIEALHHEVRSMDA